MKLVLLLALLAGGECVLSRVAGQTGHSVTLPCKYDISPHGALTVCWGRGDLPARGCGNQLVSTDGQKVTERASSRYQLLGRLDAGDVSLTILNLTETDAGRYGCRVMIPGLFNDDKQHVDVTLETAQTTTSTTASTEASTEPTAAAHSAGQMTSAQSQLTSCYISVKAEQEKDSGVSVALVWVLFVLVASLTAGAGALMARSWRRRSTNAQQVTTSVQFNQTSSTLQLHSRGSVVENIYQIDGGEYEYCP